MIEESPDLLIVLRRKRDPSYYEPIVAIAAKHGLRPVSFPDRPAGDDDFVVLSRGPRAITAGKPAGRLSGQPFHENGGRRL